MPALPRTAPVLLAVLASALLIPSEAEARRRGGGGWHPEQVLSSIFNFRISPPARPQPVRRARRSAPPRAVAPQQQMAEAEAPSPAPAARPPVQEVASAPLPPARPAAILAAADSAPAALVTPAAAAQSASVRPSPAPARAAERSTWIEPVR